MDINMVYVKEYWELRIITVIPQYSLLYSMFCTETGTYLLLFLHVEI